MPDSLTALADSLRAVSDDVVKQADAAAMKMSDLFNKMIASL